MWFTGSMTSGLALYCKLISHIKSQEENLGILRFAPEVPGKTKAPEYPGAYN